MAGKQEGIEDVKRTVLQDPHGKVKAKLLEAQFQEVQSRPTGKTSETGTSFCRKIERFFGQSSELPTMGNDPIEGTNEQPKPS